MNFTAASEVTYRLARPPIANIWIRKLQTNKNQPQIRKSGGRQNKDLWHFLAYQPF